MKTRIALTCLALCLVSTPFLMAQPAAQFAKANQEYAAGDFKAAIADYEELVRFGQDTPILATPFSITSARLRLSRIIPKPRRICGSHAMKRARWN